MKIIFSLLVFLTVNNVIFPDFLNFGAPFQINSNSDSLDSSFNKSNLPYVVSNDKGEVVVVWQTILDPKSPTGNIYTASRHANGTWTQERQLNATSGGSANISLFPQVALNNNGVAVVVWQSVLDKDQGTGDVYISKRNTNGVWSQEKRLTQQVSAEEPHVALNDNNETLVVWSTPSSYITTALIDAEGRLSDQNSILGKDGNIAFNNKGEAIVVGTRKVENSLQQVWSSSRSAEGVWSDPEPISSTYDNVTLQVFSFSVVLNDNGVGVVAFSTQEGKGKNAKTNVYAVTRNPDKTWNTEQQLSTGASSNISSRPNVSLNNNNEALFVWAALNATLKTQISYISTKKTHGTWTSEQQLSPESQAAIFPLVSLNDNGEALASWNVINLEENSGRKIKLNLFYKSRTPEGLCSDAKIVGSKSLILTFLQSQSLNNLNEGVFVFPTGFFSGDNFRTGNIFGAQTTTKAEYLWKISQTQNSFYPQKNRLLIV